MEDQKLISMVGLPGSGKSTYIKKNFEFLENYGCDSFGNSHALDEYLRERPKYIYSLVTNNEDMSNYNIISADDIKEYYSYGHEDSVELAEKTVYYCLRHGCNVIMDGGGINNHYTVRIINEAREINPNIFIKAVYLNTPVEVCIDRINKRERKVPIENIYEKNQKVPRCINQLKELCDEFETVNYFANKFIFLDMDGTICSYSTVCKDIDGNIDFVNGELFKYLTPVHHIIQKIYNNFPIENVFILTACPNSIAWSEKQDWITKNVPFIPKNNIYFVGNKDYKHVFLKHLMLKLKMKPNEVCMIDDNNSILGNMEKIGINAIHPSNIDSIIEKK